MSFDAHKADLILGVVGTGTMGRGIAQIAAAAGISVRLFDAAPGAVDAALAFVAKAFARLAEKGKMRPDAAAAASARLAAAATLDELAPCDLVVEAIIEDLAIKRRLFADLEAVVGPDCVLASNTSSLSVTAIAAGVARPQRVAGFHFFNPVPLMKIVEVAPGLQTEAAVTEALLALGRRMGHAAVATRDLPGFLINHAGRGYGTEALRVLGEGVADIATIDRIMVEGAGFRMGPFELLDLIGIDVTHSVMESIYGQFYDEPRFRPSPLAAQLKAGQMYGRKSGRGFYVYENGQIQRPPDPAMPIPADLPPVWIAPDARAPLTALLGAARIETTAQPGAEALILLAPIGADATTTALALGVDPTRVVAVDPIFGLESGRRTLMTTPITRAAYRAAAQALLAADGAALSVIHDSPGFVAQRVLACMVNIAADIAQQRIASPADIDLAVPLGLGYPRGPLAWGDAIGADRILVILDALCTFYGDPRYRPSPWLTRRARLGVSLTTPEN